MAQTMQTTQWLQQLQQQHRALQRAALGSPHTPPQRQAETEDIEAKIAILERELAALQRQRTKLTIRYTRPGSPPATFEAQGTTVIVGRFKLIPVDLELAWDQKISRPHIRLFYHLSTWWVENLKPENKPLLNEIAITEPTPLSPGDKLQLGDTVLIVDFATRQAAPPLVDFAQQKPVDEFTPALAEDKRTALLAKMQAIRADDPAPHVLLERCRALLQAALPQADHHALLLVDVDKELIAPLARPSEPMQVSYTLARRAIRQRKALHWERTLAADQEHIASLSDETMAALCAPMIVGGQVIGVLYADTNQPQQVFDESAIALLSELATTMAFGLQGFDRQRLPQVPAVFIAYAPPEQALVKRLAGDLRRRRIKVWFDQELRVGSDPEQAREKAIAATDALLLVASPTSVETKPVLTALEQAQAAQKMIFPIVAQPCQLPAGIGKRVPLVLKPEHCDADITDLAEMLYEELLARPKSKATAVQDAAKRTPNSPASKPGPGLGNAFGLAPKEPNRILVLAANPSGTVQLQLLQEVETIKRMLKEGQYDDQFVVIQELTANLNTLFGSLQRYKPQIVHFAGHGDQAGGIKLADEQGMSRTLGSEVLRDLFALLKEHVRCVVLNACFSANQAEAIATEIDCVVGMAGEIEDDAAICFSGSFYQALANGENVESAMNYSRVAIRAKKFTDAAQLQVKPGVNAADITFV